MACKHNKIWILSMASSTVTSDGLAVKETYLWCYECGSIRSTDARKWINPVGKGGKNPALSEGL